MKKTGPKPIKDILKAALERAEEQKKGLLSEEEANNAWKDIVGAKAAQHTRLKQMTRTVLTVDVDSPTWIYQLNIDKEKIEERFNRQLKKTPRIKIKFRAGAF